jgi:hypothetical protein
VLHARLPRRRRELRRALHRALGMRVEEHLAHAGQGSRPGRRVGQVKACHLDAAGELARPRGAARRAHRFPGRRQPRQHGPADVAPGTGHQNGHGASSFRRAGGAGRIWNTATWPAAAAKASGSGLVVMPARANIGAPLGTSRG